MREAFNIIGKILTGTATENDRRRLEHLCADQARRMKRPKSKAKIQSRGFSRTRGEA